MEQLSEEEKKALRGSKFAPLPSAPSSSRPQSRLAHPGGPMKTNKAAALAKFLDRKLQDPSGLSSLDPRLIELAVKNAKHTLQASEHPRPLDHPVALPGPFSTPVRRGNLVCQAAIYKMHYGYQYCCLLLLLFIQSSLVLPFAL
ncbi:hypothetical protein KY284_001606 [Solanum tuberosum]|nr:hypothetical protein KY284_001606 [Solanum tuberosum]